MLLAALLVATAALPLIAGTEMKQGAAFASRFLSGARDGATARFIRTAPKATPRDSTQTGAAGATQPAVSPGKFKASGAKASAAPGGGVTPQVLGCANATASIGSDPAGVNGTLAFGDCTNPIDGSFYDAYSFTGTAGQQVVITMTSTAFDTYL
ncbi:MAG: hypothetical protein QOF61_3201, partial [Acidobacteriota bacterium]|nr:hypothetical protein [Acidobacteriota bacterium]